MTYASDLLVLLSLNLFMKFISSVWYVTYLLCQEAVSLTVVVLLELAYLDIYHVLSTFLPGSCAECCSVY